MSNAPLDHVSSEKCRPFDADGAFGLCVHAVPGLCDRLAGVDLADSWYVEPLVDEIRAAGRKFAYS